MQWQLLYRTWSNCNCRSTCSVVAHVKVGLWLFKACLCMYVQGMTFTWWWRWCCRRCCMGSWCSQTSRKPAAWSPSPRQTYWWRLCYWSPTRQSAPRAEGRERRQKNDTKEERGKEAEKRKSKSVHISLLSSQSCKKPLFAFVPWAETLSIKFRAPVEANQSHGTNSTHLLKPIHSTYLTDQPVIQQRFNWDHPPS